MLYNDTTSEKENARNYEKTKIKIPKYDITPSYEISKTQFPTIVQRQYYLS